MYIDFNGSDFTSIAYLLHLIRIPQVLWRRTAWRERVGQHLDKGHSQSGREVSFRHCSTDWSVKPHLLGIWQFCQTNDIGRIGVGTVLLIDLCTLVGQCISIRSPYSRRRSAHNAHASNTPTASSVQISTCFVHKVDMSFSSRGGTCCFLEGIATGFHEHAR